MTPERPLPSMVFSVTSTDWAFGPIFNPCA
jgi:hypothetical protein